MKTFFDPRHQTRQRIIQELFRWSFQKQKILQEKSNVILDNIETIDQAIKEAAPLWPIEQLNKIDLAILRLSLYELLLEKTTPAKVIVDEAVELAKEFGAEKSGKFINGVLGTVINNDTK